MKRFKKPDGFSLIEVLIALVILSISLLALAGLMVYTTKSNSWGGHITEAATFGQYTLEQLRVTPWGNVNTDPGPNTITGFTGINYGRSWTVVSNADDTLKTITVTVAWNDGIDHSISFVSAISR